MDILQSIIHKVESGAITKEVGALEASEVNLINEYNNHFGMVETITPSVAEEVAAMEAVAPVEEEVEEINEEVSEKETVGEIVSPVESVNLENPEFPILDESGVFISYTEGDVINPEAELASEFVMDSENNDKILQ